MFKSNGGFTLVELIVVIAILAILAGVAVPAYSGYIEKANSAADIVELDAVKTACQAALATISEVKTIEVISGGSVVVTYPDADDDGEDETVTMTSNADFKLFYGEKAPTLKTGDKANWASNTWTITKNPKTP